jgi:glycosyltransferase involved in cell wall biosynthesis
MFCHFSNEAGILMKKVLFVIDSLNSGGAEKSLISLLTLFNYEKYDVDLLLFSTEGLYLSLLPDKVNIINVPEFIQKQRMDFKYLIKGKNYHELYTRIRISFSMRNPFKRKNMHSAQIIWNWLSKEIPNLEQKYDFAIAYSQGIPTYFVAEKVKATKKFCWINTDYRVALYNKKYDKKYYEQFDNIIAVSDYNRDIFIKEIPSLQQKTCVIYDIVSPKLIRSMAKQRGGFNDFFDGIRILTIGRIVSVKGYDLAIEACYKLKKSGYKIKWYAIGEGNLKYEYEKKIKEFNIQDTFIFLGTHCNPYTYLSQCDIYVQPSRFEGYGLAIAEARILWKPIIATNFTVVHNQIKDKENGLIVSMDPDDIFHGIKNLIEDNNLRNQLIVNLHNTIKGTEEEISKIYALMESK